MSRPRRKLKSARIRGAVVRPHPAASIAALIVKGLASSHLSPVTVITRNVLPARQWVRQDSPGNPSLWFPAGEDKCANASGDGEQGDGAGNHDGLLSLGSGVN